MRASLINGKPIEALDIRWSTGDTGIVKILGAGGPEVGVQTLAAGTAAVIAQHAQSKNTLTFTVLVAGAGQIHLLPGKTAYLGSVGETIAVSATLYGVRSPVELLGITWSSADAAIAQLVGSTGSSIQVIAKKIGTTTITPSHPKARNSPPITIHVSAAKKRRQDVKYLAARTNAMELQIDAAENLRVRLIGGNALDEQGITWGVDDSTRLQMIGTSGSTVIVKGLMAGTVTVTASHPQSVNSLSITINVRDAVRRLLLSSSTMRLKKNGDSKALTLSIRGGFDTDYDNLSWSSSNESVATVFGRNRTVNIQPGTVPGNATITAELTLTGQKVTALVEVLPDMYIRLPRNMRVEEGKSATFTFEFATNGNPITFSSYNSDVTVVQGSGTDENKITVYGAAKKEGTFSIRATAAGGINDSAGVEVFVKRSLSVPNKATINIEPMGGIDKAVVRYFTVVPEWEAKKAVDSGKIHIYTQSGGNDIVKFTTHPNAGTVAVHTIKEGVDALYIHDRRTTPYTVHRIPIRSEYEDISSLITVNPQSIFNWTAGTLEEGIRGGLFFQEEKADITVSVDKSINNQGLSFSTPAYEYNEKTPYLYLRIVTDSKHKTAIAQYHGMKPGAALAGSLKELKHTYNLNYTINHGADGKRVYTGTISFSVQGWGS